MKKENNRTDMPSPEAIMEHWLDKFNEQGIWDIVSIDRDGIPAKACFGCGCPSKVERAHITALVNGGTNDLDNLHLLCRGCHVESESYSGEVYDKWFRWKINQQGWLSAKLQMLVETGLLESHPLYIAYHSEN